MAAKRYELTDTQWDRIKDLIPRAKTGRPPKDDRMMLNAMLWLARSGAGPGRISLHDSGRIRPFTADSASGVTTEPFCAFFRN